MREILSFVKKSVKKVKKNVKTVDKEKVICYNT